VLTHLENTGTVNIARTGTTGGSPLVLLHPLGMDLTWWGDQFREFGPERDVIAMDMPGHGLSAQPDAPPTFDMMADAMEALLESIGGKPAHLVGLSVGGMIAQTLALRRPDLVQSLTLVGTLCTFPDEIRKVLLERARIARTEAALTCSAAAPSACYDSRANSMRACGRWWQGSIWNTGLARSAVPPWSSREWKISMRPPQRRSGLPMPFREPSSG